MSLAGGIALILALPRYLAFAARLGQGLNWPTGC